MCEITCDKCGSRIAVGPETYPHQTTGATCWRCNRPSYAQAVGVA